MLETSRSLEAAKSREYREFCEGLKEAKVMGALMWCRYRTEEDRRCREEADGRGSGKRSDRRLDFAPGPAALEGERPRGDVCGERQTPPRAHKASERGAMDAFHTHLQELHTRLAAEHETKALRLLEDG